jgi:hypothetical protein
MADYWIKVYHEILDDPKMATMPDRLWRRTMEIFLLSGKLSKDKSGFLPETNQLAWLLRMSSDDLLMDLKQLESVGILERVGDGWLVVNFEKRQAAVSDAERKRQQREREQREQYYGNEKVPNLSRNVTQNTEYREQNTETESESERERARASDPKPKIDHFDLLQTEIESVIGLPQGSDAVKAIQELVTIGAEACDIREAADWYRSNGKTIHSARSLIGPVKTALMKRKQQARSPTLERKKDYQKSASERYLEQEQEKYDVSIRL